MKDNGHLFPKKTELDTEHIGGGRFWLTSRVENSVEKSTSFRGSVWSMTSISWHVSIQAYVFEFMLGLRGPKDSCLYPGHPYFDLEPLLFRFKAFFGPALASLVQRTHDVVQSTRRDCAHL